LKASELMQRLGLAHRPTFSNNYLKPALVAGLIEMTDPASPRSPAQKYRRTGFSK
ncbi:Fic family protein, partial [Rhodococcus sp. WS7]